MNAGTLTRGRLWQHPVWGRALGEDGLGRRLILPIVVSDAVEERQRVEHAAGIERLSVTEAVREAQAAAVAGLAGVLLVAQTDRKDETALLAVQRDGVLPRAIRAIKERLPDLAVASEVCVCHHTAHGQCVLFGRDGADVPATLERLGEIAQIHADCGADLLLPTGMLDGTTRAVREALATDHPDVPVAATVAMESALYALGRAVVGAVPIPERAVPLLADASAARARAERDVAAGADAILVMPGVPALDVVALLSGTRTVPVVSFQSAAEHALFTGDEDVGGPDVEREMIAATRRAGAAFVISYGGLSALER
ncbi:MAG TPA: hypothetical protein VMJ92_04560 [Candidatus Limnocylindrales bacterium]|nr:hypothetical protein [Candidatus Limnocylindrales bacterium]